jgi:DNA polymerase-3 subunit gamma/tau
VPLAEQLSAEDAQLYYQIALHGRRDLPIGRDPRIGFEMTLLRMLAFRPAASDDVVARRERGTGSAPSGSTAGAKSGGSGATARVPAEPTPPKAAVASAAPPAEWSRILETLDLRGPARQLADSCDLQSQQGAAWQLVLPADKEHLNTQQLRARLEAALREQYGRELRLAVTVGKPERPTPAELRRANESTRLREAREAVESDPNIKALQAAFEATIEPDSIRSSK